MSSEKNISLFWNHGQMLQFLFICIDKVLINSIEILNKEIKSEYVNLEEITLDPTTESTVGNKKLPTEFQ